MYDLKLNVATALLWYYNFTFLVWVRQKLGSEYNLLSSHAKIILNKKTLCVITIAMICSILASLWKSQYFQRPICNQVEDLWCSLYCENCKPLSMLEKSSIVDARLVSKYASAFWRLFKRNFSFLSFFEHFKVFFITRLLKSVQSYHFFKVLYFF